MSKPLVVAKTTEISHADWLDARRKGVGGSDAAAVCGLSRYSSALNVWLQKTGRKPATPDNEAMQWGRLLEPVVREEFSHRTSLTVKECPYILQSREHPFMIANVDGIVTEKDGTKCVLEIKKTTNSFTTAKDTEDGLPAEWFCQIQHYLAVTGLSKAYVVVLIGGNKLQWQVVDRDEETIQTLIALESHFWDFVVRDVPPPVDANSGDALALLYPTSTESSVVLPTEADELVAQYLEIKKAEDELKAAKAEMENKLKALLKDAESGVTPSGFSVSWKAYSQSRLDSAKLKAAHADIVNQFSTTITGRKFSVSAPKTAKK